jgi:hypothetical protein
MCFTICATAFAVRLYIRYMCFRKLLIDDYLMVLALGLLFALSTMCQVFLVDIYEFIAVSNNSKIPGPDFLNVMSRGMRGFGTAMLLANIGIYTIKLSFLLFFRRLGAQIMSYQIFWWSVLVFTIGCLAVALRVMQYDCMFGNVTHIIGVCATHDTVRKTYTFFKLSCILDVVSDAFSKSYSSFETRASGCRQTLCDIFGASEHFSYVSRGLVEYY